MIDVKTAKPTTSFALAMGMAMLSGQPAYPVQIETFRNHQIDRTHSDFIQSLRGRSVANEQFALQISGFFASLAERQAPLGEDFQAAIFSDLEALYEA